MITDYDEQLTILDKLEIIVNDENIKKSDLRDLLDIALASDDVSQAIYDFYEANYE